MNFLFLGEVLAGPDLVFNTEVSASEDCDEKMSAGEVRSMYS